MTRSLLATSFLIVLLCSAQTTDILQNPTQAEQQNFGSGEWPVYRGSMDWPIYRGDPKGNQYVAFAQINATNVHKLRPAWEYHTGDASKRSTMYANPIVINGVMYISTPSLKAVALDAATGRQLWVFDPAKYHNGVVTRLRNRGVTYWKGKEGERIFDFVRDRVYAIDAKSGSLIQSFGKDGYIDLRENLGVDPAGVALEMTSPGAVYKNLLILGSRVNETYGASPGYIRAYDTVTGQLKWTFHTIPQPGEFGYDTWSWPKGETFGGANAWGGVTIDEQRGWVFVATGSATDDFYGGFRKGKDLFSDCVLALDATTGKLKWHYQTVRHDLWDYDNPPAPILVTLRNGKTSRDAVVQLTKMGLVFVLDRDTGEPIFPVQDVPVPRSDVPGEETWPTQPIPLKPPPLVRQAITEADLTNVTPEAHEYALHEFRKYRSGSIYNPPSLRGTITMPGHLGGAEWHGGSFDPRLNVLYVNVNEVPTINRLRPVYGTQNGKTEADLGRQIYETNCMACHGANRKGDPPQIPALFNLDLRRPEFKKVITEGRNNMPAFRQLHDQELNALAAYVSSAPAAVPTSGATARRYSLDGYIQFADAHGVPLISPPWGTLNAIDLHSGRILWKVPLGEYPELAAKGIHNTGTMNFGGAVATAGGVVFIAATADEKIRAFESYSGRVLWEYQLPAGGYATPSVYVINGQEYVAIAAGGGGKNATKAGDSIIAFALPDASHTEQPATSDWIQLFDGKTLNGWVHMNGSHTFDVEDGAIVGRTVEGSVNSFLCSLREFDNFELELETYIDPLTNSGIQIRTKVRPITEPGSLDIMGAGRVNGPQVEIRRFYKGLPTTGVLYGEALRTGWLSSQQKIEQGHPYFVADGWNKLRIVANGPRIQTWVNGHLIEDLANEQVYKTHAKGFIGLQVHTIGDHEVNQPENATLGITKSQPLMVKFRNIRIRPLAPNN
ncbi:MAG TPA: family 16 glycoside hydrolase [Bryobacteraceae bacterium]